MSEPGSQRIVLQGSRRRVGAILAALQARSIQVDEAAPTGLVGIRRRKRPATTVCQLNVAAAPHLAGASSPLALPEEPWLVQRTRLSAEAGWLQTCLTQLGFRRRLLAWATAAK